MKYSQCENELDNIKNKINESNKVYKNLRKKITKFNEQIKNRI